MHFGCLTVDTKHPNYYCTALSHTSCVISFGSFLNNLLKDSNRDTIKSVLIWYKQNCYPSLLSNLSAVLSLLLDLDFALLLSDSSLVNTWAFCFIEVQVPRFCFAGLWLQPYTMYSKFIELQQNTGRKVKQINA